MPLSEFHPLIQQWFVGRFREPTEAQRLGWPEIVAGRNTLIAAPTGSGKTLSAFLVCIDRLVRQGLAGDLPDEIQAVYISPLKALGNDIGRNLQTPLAEIRALAEVAGQPLPHLRVAVRSGDTPSRDRQAMLRRAPHILVTTPESLYLLLTAARGRELLRTTRTVIVDEIHALARDKRGSHLSLSLERLDALCPKRPVRIGLSATQKPVDEIARYLVGVGNQERPAGESFNPKPQAPARGTEDGEAGSGIRDQGVGNEERGTGNGERGTQAETAAGSFKLKPKAPADAKDEGERPTSNVQHPTSNEDSPAGDNQKSKIKNQKCSPPCSIVDVGHVRNLDLAVEVPPSELSAVCSMEQWAEVYQRLAELIQTHRSTLVFVNTRRMAERVCQKLGETLGQDHVASHHGSLSKEIRLSAERRLQSGELKAIVATASLELGIDIGYIDLVCQIGSPRSIATFLQRVGRSGHSLGALPKGRLFPLSRDELLECLALVRAVRQRRLDKIEIPQLPRDILAQQIVAAVAAEDWSEDDLFALCRGAWPFRDLTRDTFDQVLNVLSEGMARGNRRGAWLHRDRINGRLRARKGARIAALTSGGAIPELADYRVVTEGEGTFIGTVNEDFAIESLSGDVFLLGNTSWRIRYVRGGEVVVVDAQGAPATIPFWLGEAPGRTIELSEEISALREELAASFNAQPEAAAEQKENEERGTGNGERGTEEGQVAAGSFDPKPQAPAGAEEECERPTSNVQRSTSNENSNDDSSPAPFAVPRSPLPVLHSDLSNEDSSPGDNQKSKIKNQKYSSFPLAWLQQECGDSPWAAEQAANYVAAQVAAVGLAPTCRRILFERFFDESGGMQLVIHSPLGARINRAWGLAMRKRFCRSFDFELQASADDNGIVLSLGPQHSFALDTMFKMLNRQNGRDMLVQALLAVPMFRIRWRWNATRALAVLRQRGGKKVPPPLQRFHADDLLTAVFPAQTACQENRPGDIEVPDHPLVEQTVYDCLHEAMDIDRWLGLLGDIEEGRVELVGRDTREPSPFSYEILNANPYAFLDDAPLEERRARAVFTRRTVSAADMGDLAWLDPAAIRQVVADAQPVVRSADELHDWLLQAAAVEGADDDRWRGFFAELVVQGRATLVRRPGLGELWAAAERWPLLQAAYPGAAAEPPVSLPPSLQREYSLSEAAVALVRGRMETCGPATAASLADALGLDAGLVEAALEALESEGCVMRGQFTNASTVVEWCDRRLLARIHRLTLDAARRAVQPVEPADFLRFLVQHQHVGPAARLTHRPGLIEVVSQLQGFEAPAGAWERDLLPARLAGYDSEWLDEATWSGEIAWGRLQPPRRPEDEIPSGSGLTRVVPISLVARSDLGWLLPPERGQPETRARADARLVYDTLVTQGALFFPDLMSATALLPAQLEDALSELAALGVVTSDGFAPIRTLVATDRHKGLRHRKLVRRRQTARAYTRGGRWSRFPAAAAAEAVRAARVERWAWQLLRRYGVMFRDLLERESVAPPWRELAHFYRRLEAQGKVRGGRFVAGVGGEQFAAVEAVAELRRVRDLPATGELAIVSACDPLNLAGILTPLPRVPAIHTNALALEDGRLAASLEAGDVKFHRPFPPEQAAGIERMLRMSAATRGKEAPASPAAGTADRRVQTDGTRAIRDRTLVPSQTVPRLS